MRILFKTSLPKSLSDHTDPQMLLDVLEFEYFNLRSEYMSESRFRSLGATEPKVELRMHGDHL